MNFTDSIFVVISEYDPGSQRRNFFMIISFIHWRQFYLSNALKLFWRSTVMQILDGKVLIVCLCYFKLFYIFCFGPHPTVLMVYFWFSAQGSLLAGFGDLYMVIWSHLGWRHARQGPCTLYLYFVQEQVPSL